MKKILILLVLLIPAVVQAHDVVSANGYKCNKSNDGTVGCGLNIESLQKPAVVGCSGQDKIILTLMYANLEKESSETFQYDSKTGCVYAVYLDKEGKATQKVLDRSGKIHKLRNNTKFDEIKVKGCD